MHRRSAHTSCADTLWYEIFLQAFLRADSQTQGQDTGIHLGADGTNIIGMISRLMNVVAGGIALAETYLGTDRVVPPTSATVARPRNLSRSDELYRRPRPPVVTVIEDNQWAYGTPNSCSSDATRWPTVAPRTARVRVDGTDLCAVYEATREAVERARRGEGPSLIESLTMRMRGHAEHDSQHYVDSALLDEWAAKDPVQRYLDWLEEGNRLPGVDIPALRERLAAEVLNACDRAREAPEPPLEAARGHLRRRRRSRGLYRQRSP